MATKKLPKKKTYVVDMSINVRAESAGHADKIVRERVKKVKGIRITNVDDWKNWR
jgi:hypothetical protein